MEILPHFWISYYKKNLLIIKEKKIKNIIHLSKFEKFIHKDNIEEICIPLDYTDDQSLEEKNNIIYDYLYDITNYINKKVTRNENILLLGYSNKQDIETIVIAYFIKFGKLNIHDSIIFLKSKKENIFQPKCLFYYALNKFYNEINK